MQEQELQEVSHPSSVRQAAPSISQPVPRLREKKLNRKKIIKSAIVVGAILAVIIVIALRFKEAPAAKVAVVGKSYQQGLLEYNQTVGKKFAWIRQRVDHLNPSDERYFFQRVFINVEGSNLRRDAPVFLYVPEFQPLAETQKSVFLTQLIQQKKAISMALEPRYFGESLPFGGDSHSLHNLKYLSLEQMVEDLAYVIRRIIDNRFFGITEKNLWVINGAKVPGTIAAWLRAKYPQLSCGAIASSPILPTTLVPLVNERLYAKVESGGKKCRVAMEKIKQNLQEQLADDRADALRYEMGQGLQLSDEEILYLFLSRINSLPKQLYIFACDAQEESKLISEFRTILLTSQYSTFDPIAFSQDEMVDEEEWRDIEVVRTERVNWYLKCTQTGLFQIAPERKSFASRKFNEEFFRKRCKNIFGAELWPRTEEVRKEYEPYLQTASNLLLIHGYYDVNIPYALKGQSKQTETLIKKCLRCETAFDYSKYPLKHREIQDALEAERKSIDRWLKNGKK